MRVYSLIRLLEPETDLKAINNSAQIVDWWRRLRTDLTVWRGAFPTAEKHIAETLEPLRMGRGVGSESRGIS